VYSDLLPYFFIESFDYLTVLPLDCTENLETMLERMVVNGYDEIYLHEIRRFYKSLVSRESPVTYATWLKYYEVIE